MVFDVTLTSQPSWKLKSAFVQLQNLFFKFKFLSFWRTSSKYGIKHQICGQLCVNKRAKFGAKIFTHFSEIAIFVLGRFILTHSADNHDHANHSCDMAAADDEGNDTFRRPQFCQWTEDVTHSLTR